MKAWPFLRRVVDDQRGSVAEFALVLPLAMLLLFGVMDAGRYLYDVNRGEKAVQVGARFAIVTDPIAQELASESYVGATVGGTTLTQGDRIPADALGLITCNQSSCTCTTAPCPSTLTRDDPAFDRLVARMKLFMPGIADSNLIVEYRGSGLGYAGDPNGMDIAPLVAVRLANMSFSPFMLFGGVDIDLPVFSYTLTMEDGQGTGSN